MLQVCAIGMYKKKKGCNRTSSKLVNSTTRHTRSSAQPAPLVSLSQFPFLASFGTAASTASLPKVHRLEQSSSVRKLNLLGALSVMALRKVIPGTGSQPEQLNLVDMIDDAPALDFGLLCG